MTGIFNLLLALAIIALFITWIHAVVTYDWTKFEEDKKKIDEDPYSHFP